MSNIKSLLLEEFPRVREDKVLPTILDLLDQDPNTEILVFWPSQRASGEGYWPYFTAIEQKLEQLGKTIEKKNKEHLFWSGGGRLHVYPCGGISSLRGVFGKHIFIPIRTPDETILECVGPILVKHSDTKVYMVDDIPWCQKLGYCPSDSGCELQGHQEKL